MHWYGIRAMRQPGRKVHADGVEADLAGIFGRRGWGAYVPCEDKRVKASRGPVQWEYRKKPIIPGLVMVSMPGNLEREPKLWFDLICINYVHSIYGNGGIPKPIKWEQVERMMTNAGDSPEDFEPKRAPRFSEGDTVEFTNGSLAGLSAKVMSDDGEVYKLMFEMFGSEREIESMGENLKGVVSV